MSVILTVQNLKKYFPIRTGIFAHTPLRAVDDVSFDVQYGETIGLVGESGSGKTTLGLCLLRLIEPTAGEVLFEGKDFTNANAAETRLLRQQFQVVFQDPLDSLNPRMKVGDIVGEPLQIHGLGSRSTIRERIIELFERVNLGEEHIDRYPHQLSGGQRQRVAIARALATNPKLVVLDEPTSALDVSVQAQLLNLLRKLQDDLGLSFIFISHDLAVVSHLSDRVAVMYLGEIIEFGPTGDVFQNPRHPYTMSLLSAIPGESLLDDHRRVELSGEIPSPLRPPAGCRFHTRCPFVQSECRTELQYLQPIEANSEHTVACSQSFKGNIPPFWVESDQGAKAISYIDAAYAYLKEKWSTRQGG